MSKKITIYKWKGNTQWSVDIEDSYGKEHHLGYYEILSPEIMSEIEADAEMLWQSEVKPEEDLMSKAIAECIQSDIDRGVEPSLDQSNYLLEKYEKYKFR